MKRMLDQVPTAGLVALMVVGGFSGFGAPAMRLTAALVVLADLAAVYLLGRTGDASPIHKGMTAYAILAGLGWWLSPDWAGGLLSRYSGAGVYAVLFLVAVGPPLLGREVFTLYFARKTTPAAVWQTPPFKTINYHLTGFWAALFFISFGLGLIPGLASWSHSFARFALEWIVPGFLMAVVGVIATKRYPAHYQRKLGLTLTGPPQPAGETRLTGTDRPEQPQIIVNPMKKEGISMSQKPTIVAVNGSPHAGGGSTSMAMEMLRGPLAAEGFELEIIHLAERHIEYCQGCAFCLEKGQCWIDDDHKRVIKRLLDADAIVLGSPVYYQNVTGQMKTFLDRSLAYGHKPRPTMKPGLAVCVSAGYGETATGQYLANVLRSFGAFAVGTLTAMAVAPGGFLGKELVEARAADLARELSRAIKEKRRFPATDQELHFYHFMGNLVRSHKDSIMKHDDQHWSDLGFYDGFEKFVQQTWTEVPDTSGMRDAWIKQMIADYKENKKMTTPPPPPENHGAGSPPLPKTCLEMIRMMPKGFNASAAEGLSAVFQFEVSGDETFTAHLVVADGKCEYQDGPAEKPDVTVKTPASVWLAIASGEVSGQQAFMSGQYKVEGNFMLLMKLGALFSRK